MKDLDDDLELELGELDDDVEITKSADDDYFLEEEHVFSDDDYTPDTGEKSTLVDELLKAKGIKDGKIIILNEDNKESEVDFYKLTKEEQLEILNSTEPLESSNEEELSGNEAEFFKFLKEKGLTIDQYLEAYKQAAISEVESKYEQSYDIDAYGDEELFLLDLKAKYDLTDEELEKELTKAVEDPELFKKKVSKLRQEYKDLEDAYNKEQESKFNQKREEDYNQFVETMVQTAIANPELYGIELEDDEKNEVLSYLLELDDNGTSTFYKELKNPSKLYEAAWFLRYGKQAFDTLIDAYEQEIKKLKGDTPKGGNSKVIVKKEEKVKSIYDLN